MRRLAKKFTKYGEQFKQVCRTDNTAIYLRHTNGPSRDLCPAAQLERIYDVWRNDWR